MYYYNWRQSKVESHLQVVTSANAAGPVSDMALNPVNSGLCCFVGKGLFRSMVMGELVWKQYGFHKANKFNFSTVCWLNSERVLAGTVDGRIFLIENGELKSVYNIQTLSEFDPNVIDPNPLQVRPLLDSRDMKIQYFTPVRNGLMFVVDGYQVYYYKIKGNRYRKSIVFQVPRDGERQVNISEGSGDSGSNSNGDGDGNTDDSVGGDCKVSDAINTLSVSPKNKKLVCVTGTSRLYWSSTEGKSGMMDVELEPFGETLHRGGVFGLSVSDWKPIFMTCGKVDRTVKLWDYMRRTLLLSQCYDEDVHDVSLHPTGSYAVVAFQDRVVFNVIYDSVALKPRREFPADNCHLVRFSLSGHMFAVINNLVIDVYCSITFDKRFTLSGHKNKITDLVWANSDWKLVSCDVDARMCIFNLYTNEHVIDIKFLNKTFVSLAVSNNMKQIYTASPDGRVRELYNRTVIRDKDLDHGPLNTIILSRSDLILFIACQNGVILSLELPIKSQIKYKEFCIHNKTISKMRLSINDSTLITCSVDGSICIWYVKNSKGKITHATTKFSDDILVSSNYLKNKVETVSILNLRLIELEKNSENDIVQLEKSHERQLRKIKNQFSLKMELVKQKENEMYALHVGDKIRLENEITNLKQNQESDIQMLKDSYEEQLRYEDEKYVKTEKDIFDINNGLKRQTEIILTTHETSMQELAKKFEEDLKKEEDIFQKFKDELSKEMNQYEIEIDEFDYQGDWEVYGLFNEIVPEYQKLSWKNKKAQKEVNALKVKIRMAKKEEEDIKYMVDKFDDDIKKMIADEEILDEKIEVMEKTMQECNATIQGKDNWMENEKLNMKDVEIQILVLRFNKEEQIKVIDPLKMKLNNLKAFKDSMLFFKYEIGNSMEQMNLECGMVRQKIKSKKKELKQIVGGIRIREAFIKNLQLEVYYIYKGIDNEVKLRDSISSLHLKFTNSNWLDGKKSNDLLRQRQFLERAVTNLERRKTVADERQNPLQFDIVEKNQFLLLLVNKLRKEVKTNESKCKELQSIIEKKTCRSVLVENIKVKEEEEKEKEKEQEQSFKSL
ncbi:cilia- and flagella-associated protein 57-like [Melanaphis sacchari]|uniref:cilia- and flagella-associated protein 57-like n=1 Tax=Melanaphis sacchari TaxID=742174 RepID=UPI000DC132D0|nr:cilia- and flagella-associated protein 57-like [Melanaphis sacchari]